MTAITTKDTPQPRRRLFHKYVGMIALLVGGTLLTSGGLEIWFSYDENKSALAQIQHEKAVAAAARIEQFIDEITRQIGWTTRAQWSAQVIEQRRIEYLQLLRQAPAITEISHLDAQGREELRVSRLAMDRTGSGEDFSGDPRFAEAKARKTWYSPVYFRKESEPYITVAIAGVGRDSGVTVAEVNLKFIWDVISQIKVGKAGYAYAVDQRGLLIAHPDIGLVLRKTDLRGLPQVAAALAGPDPTVGQPPALTGADLAGRPVLTASTTIRPVDWFVFVDLPLTEAYQSLYQSALRTAILMLVGLGLAVLAGLFLARRMVIPIQALQEGAARLGTGDLSRRIEVRTGDELESLADQFNAMAGQLQESYAGLERKVEERTQELRESLEQQTATAEVLKVISRSPFELEQVLQNLLETAAKLADTEMGVVSTWDGERMVVRAGLGMTKEFYAEATDRMPMVGRGWASGRALADGKTHHIADVRADPAYTNGDIAERHGYRTALAVPLVREGRSLGVITLLRGAVRPYSQREIELVETFAAQAVIAMENARLFAETQARTRELTETLEQQTATAEVLKVISRSPFDLAPVLETLLDTAAKLGDADMAWIGTFDGGKLQVRAGHAMDDAFFAEAAQLVPVAGRGSAAGRALIDRRTCHIVDTLNDPDYEIKDFSTRYCFRSAVTVPLMREGEPIGVIALLRREVRPFTPREIELTETFADQAAIAVANVKLFDTVQIRTRELAQSVDELQALSEVGRAVSSTLDLRRVLDTVVANALELSGADGSSIFRYKRSTREFFLWHAAGLPAAMEQQARAMPIDEATTVMSEAARAHEPVQIADLSALPPTPLRDLSLAAGYHSALIVPLVRADRVFGALILHRREKGDFASGTVNLLSTFASQSSLAIQNARLFREIEEKGRQIEIASQHKSQFLANMSHELRTPLNAILGYTELMLDGLYGELGAKPRSVLERVQSNGKHLLGLINDVLDLAKIEAGQLTLAVGTYSVKAVVRSVIDATDSLARSKGLVLVAEDPAALPDGQGDERRLTQVLLNIVGNAIKFTDRGSVTIRTTVEGGFFTIAVKDTGPGIPEQEQARIFEEFQQVDNSSTRKKGGTGLGLAISRRIVEMHGGTIRVESTVGEGATFSIHLPIDAETAKEVA